MARDRARTKIRILTCSRCGHKWIPRAETKTPAVCPNCHSPYWNRPPLVKKKVKKRKGGKH